MLQKRVVPIVLDEGVDTGIDPKLHAGLVKAENAVFPRRGVIAKRTGTAEQYSGAMVQSIIGTGKSPHMGVYGTTPFAIHDNAAILTSSGLVQVSGNGGLIDADIRGIDAQKNELYYFADYTETAAYFAICYCFGTTGGTFGVGVESYDKETGLRIDAATPITGAGDVCHCKITRVTNASGQDICIAYFVTNLGVVQYLVISSTGTMNDTGTAIDPSGWGVNAHTFAQAFDIVRCTRSGASDIVVLLCCKSSGGDIDMVALEYGIGADSVAGSATIAKSGTIRRAGLFYRESAEDVIIAYTDDNGSVETLSVRGMTPTLSATVITNDTDVITTSASANSNTRHITGYWAPTQDKGYILVSFDTGTSIEGEDVWIVEYTDTAGTGALGTVTKLLSRSRLATKPIANATYFWLGVYTEAWSGSAVSQNDILWMRGTTAAATTSPSVVGRSFVGRAEPATRTYGSHAPLAHIVEDGDGDASVFGTVCHARDRLGDETYRFSTHHLYQVRLETEPLSSSMTETPALLISNSMPYEYSGGELVEAGFIQYPEPITLAQSASGGSMSNGTYSFRAVYEWVDSRGNIHRSAPTPTAVSITVNGGGASQKVTITCPTYPFTRKENVAVVFYRTVASGTVYYRCGAKSNVEAHTSAAYITFDATLADASISDNEILYTTGGVLEVIAPTSTRHVTTWGNRAVYVDRDHEDSRLYFSRQILIGEGVNYSDTLTIDCDPDGGAITGIKSLVDKLIIFKQARIYAVDGSEGPDDLGSGLPFRRPYLVSPSIGCVNHKTIVRVPDGLMFLTQDGIWLLSNGLQLSPIGDSVRYHTESTTLKSSGVVEDKHYAIWLTSSSTALVYDYLRQKWATFTDHAAQDAVVAGNVLYRASGGSRDGVVYKDDRSSFTDDESGSGVQLLVETGWISLSGLLGLKRVYKLLILGHNLQDHTLRVKLGYDFDSTWTDNLTYKTGDSPTKPNEFDYDTYYGSGLSGNAFDGDAYMIEVVPSKQKITALRIQISDEQLTGTRAGYSITGLALVVGVRGRGALIGAHRRS